MEDTKWNLRSSRPSGTSRTALNGHPCERPLSFGMELLVCRRCAKITSINGLSNPSQRPGADSDSRKEAADMGCDLQQAISFQLE
ncbi:hypothetical protein AVEN_259312-1 [Araneus ventricosus]|uniref:Uncharacterized protein n=1 Tax=Araneus ventricosus TaxID=182803 RepID=A0A4Y2GLG7_ARAVE|nr:hypothetical protein AVEN_259312-1 [Araneus ventricosus]